MPQGLLLLDGVDRHEEGGAQPQLLESGRGLQDVVTLAVVEGECEKGALGLLARRPTVATGSSSPA